MLDMRLLRLDIASPPPQPIHSGEPLPAPLWPLSQLLPSPPPSSQPSPATVPTDNLQQQLLPQLLPVIPQPRGLSHTAHITVNILSHITVNVFCNLYKCKHFNVQTF